MDKILNTIYVKLIYRLLVVMLLFSFSRVIFYLLNQGMFSEVTAGSFLRMMYGGLRFDLAATLYINSLFIVANIIPFKFRTNITYQKALKWIYIITNGIAFAFNSMDIIYYRFTLRRTTWSVFSEFSNDTGNTALMGQFFSDYWPIVIFWAFLMTLLILFYGKPKLNKSIIISPYVYYPSYFILMAVSLGLFVTGVRGGFRYSTRPITISNATAYTNKPIEAGIVLNTPFSIIRTLKRQAYTRHNFYKEPQLSQIYTPIHTSTDSTDFNKKNVVIIIVESLSREYIGSLNKDLDIGNYKGYTPFLDSLIQKSYVFSNAFSNGSKSIDAMPSILASVPSFADPYVLSIYSNNSIRSLAHILVDEGYSSSFFHGAPNGSMGFDAFSRHAGFSQYFGKSEFNNDSEFDSRWGIWDEPFLQFFANKLNEEKKPFVSSLFTVTSHHPFIVPDKYKGVFPKGTEDIHQTVGYTDMAIRRFFETASKMDWYKNTLFVITADHTNQVTYPKSKTSVGNFYIPIIFFDPSGVLLGESSKQMQQIDIMPTVLSYLNYNKPYFAFGFNGLDSIKQNNFAINYTNSTYQVIKDSLVLQIQNMEPKLLYNYKADPLLKTPINKQTDTLNAYFRAFIQQYNSNLIDNSMFVKPE